MLSQCELVVISVDKILSEEINSYLDIELSKTLVKFSGQN